MFPKKAQCSMYVRVRHYLEKMYVNNILQNYLFPWNVEYDMDTPQPVNARIGRACTIIKRYTCTYIEVHVHIIWKYMYIICMVHCILQVLL